MLVAENDCSKACNALLSNPPLEPTEDLLAVMSGLHPRNSCTFDTSNLEDRLERIPEFTGAEVNEAMLSFKRSSSAGLSGLRPGHILSLLDSKNAKCLLHILGVLASRLANFELPPELAPYLAGASLIAIQKPAGGVRPVACGDAIRRLTSKLMLKRVLPLVSPKLLPTQLGISVPAATEIIFHRVASQIANSTDDQKTFLVLDLKNAFNCIDRSCIMEAVMKYAPSLARWFLWCYSVPSRLCFGKFQLTSEQGVQQGDPLGSLLFALGIHDCVVNVSLTPGVLWSGWYADDATIQAPLPTLDPLLLSLSATQTEHFH